MKNATNWLTVLAAAAYASLSKDTIYAACETDELRHVRVGGRRNIRMKPEWIDAWLEGPSQNPSAPATGRGDTE